MINGLLRTSKKQTINPSKKSANSSSYSFNNHSKSNNNWPSHPIPSNDVLPTTPLSVFIAALTDSYCVLAASTRKKPIKPIILSHFQSPKNKWNKTWRDSETELMPLFFSPKVSFVKPVSTSSKFKRNTPFSSKVLTLITPASTI